MKLFRAIARLILGFTFLFAGFVKLIDPVGGGLIVSEYFKIVGIENLTVIPMLFGAFLAGAELKLEFPRSIFRRGLTGELQRAGFGETRAESDLHDVP